MSSLGKCLIRFFAHLLIRFFFLILQFVVCKYILKFLVFSLLVIILSNTPSRNFILLSICLGPHLRNPELKSVGLHWWGFTELESSNSWQITIIQFVLLTQISRIFTKNAKFSGMWQRHRAWERFLLLITGVGVREEEVRSCRIFLCLATQTLTIEELTLNSQLRHRKGNPKVRMVCSPATACAITAKKAKGHCYHTK